MEREQEPANAFGAKKTESEEKRLVSLHSLGLLDSDPNPALDGIVMAAAGLFDASIALVTLVDGDRQWFKAKFDPESKLGDTSETPRSVAFCDRTIRANRVMLVDNAPGDPFFKDNPLVTESPNLRFYVGAPLRTPEGEMIGALCVLDTEEKHAASEQQEALSRLSVVVVDMLLNEANNRKHYTEKELPESAEAEDRILSKAIEILIEYGASDFSVRKVARKAGVSLGHLQHYFSNKRSLLLAVLDSALEQLNSYQQELTAIANPNDRIMHCATFVLDRGAEFPLFQLLREYWLMSTRDEEIARALSEIHEHSVQFLAAAIREANTDLDQQTAESKAAVSLVLLSGAFLYQGRSEDRDSRIRQSILESLIVLRPDQQAA